MGISLRPLEKDDVDRIAQLANDRDIARMTASLPYPYTVSDAKKWLEYIFRTENEHVFAIVVKKKIVGIVGLVHEPENNRAELGYWLGKEYWGKGYVTSAVEIMLGVAFGVLKVNKVYSYVFGENNASQKVLIKNGFVCEGELKQHYIRMGTVHDLMIFGLLKDNYNN